MKVGGRQNPEEAPGGGRRPKQGAPPAYRLGAGCTAVCLTAGIYSLHIWYQNGLCVLRVSTILRNAVPQKVNRSQSLRLSVGAAATAACWATPWRHCGLSKSPSALGYLRVSFSLFHIAQSGNI